MAEGDVSKESVIVTLVCDGCKLGFDFTYGELLWYIRKHIPLPKRCELCRGHRNVVPSTKVVTETGKTFWLCTCEGCQETARVPFEPAPGRPIFCHDCYQVQSIETISRTPK